MNLDPLKIPLELRQLNRWICWRLDTRGDKPTKIPIQAGNLKLASSTNQTTWCDFVTAYEETNCDGIGFVLGDGYCGIDLDKCRDPVLNKMTEEAQTIIDDISSYTEASPSGLGVHILVKGSLPNGWRKLGFVEMYSEGRYFTVTGQRLGIRDTIEERTEQLAYLHKRLDGVLFNEKRPPKVKADPNDFHIKKFPSSQGIVDKYTAQVHKVTGKASCSCPGWKYRMSTGKPCWHVLEMLAEHGFTYDA